MGSVSLVSRRTNSEVPLAVREGVLLPLFVVVCCLASFGILDDWASGQRGRRAVPAPAH